MMTYSEMKNSVLKSMNKWDYDVMYFMHTFLVGLDIIEDDTIKPSKQEIRNECKDKISYSTDQETQEYKKLGTLEEIRDAVKRQHVMKPILHMNEMSGMFVDYADGRGEYKTQTNNWWRCPCCNSIVGERVIIRGKSHDQRKKRFCNKCGQHIDWSNNERNE